MPGASGDNLLAGHNGLTRAELLRHHAADGPAYDRYNEELATVVDGQLPVLVLGETGVGKEHIARVLHDSSSRRERPFVSQSKASNNADDKAGIWTFSSS